MTNTLTKTTPSVAKDLNGFEQLLRTHIKVYFTASFGNISKKEIHLLGIRDNKIQSIGKFRTAVYGRWERDWIEDSPIIEFSKEVNAYTHKKRPTPPVMAFDDDGKVVVV